MSMMAEAQHEASAGEVEAAAETRGCTEHLENDIFEKTRKAQILIFAVFFCVTSLAGFMNMGHPVWLKIPATLALDCILMLVVHLLSSWRWDSARAARYTGLVFVSQQAIAATYFVYLACTHDFNDFFDGHPERLWGPTFLVVYATFPVYELLAGFFYPTMALPSRLRFAVASYCQLCYLVAQLISMSQVGPQAAAPPPPTNFHTVCMRTSRWASRWALDGVTTRPCK